MKHYGIAYVKALICAITLTVLGATPVFGQWMSTCSYYTNGLPIPQCGDPPPVGLCPGNCVQTTYSAKGGQCVYTGNLFDSCTPVAPFPITETTTYYLCDIRNDENHFWCICTTTADPGKTTTQVKMCNCK